MSTALSKRRDQIPPRTSAVPKTRAGTPRKLELVPSDAPAPAASLDASARADRLVRPDVAAHYMRQGERIADALMAVTAALRRLLPQFRHDEAAKTRAMR
jgi:hypothetical protein